MTKETWQHGLGLIWLTLCISLPRIFGGSLVPECSEMHKHVLYFTAIIAVYVAILLIAMASLGCKKIRGRRGVLFAESVKSAFLCSVISKVIVLGLGYTVWFWVFSWEVFSLNQDVCFTGWSRIDYFNYIFAVIYTLLPALLNTTILGCGLCLLICLGPSICRENASRRAAQREEES